MELLDIYDNNGNKTGKKVVRGDKTAVLNENEHIAVAVIFIENSEGKFLMQKTSTEKGGQYSSTGGHVDSGETALSTIRREVEEELGINIDNEPIEEYGYLLYDKPLRFMFYLHKDINLNDVVVQDEEVEYVTYMTKEEILELIENKQITESHGIIFKKILELKSNSKH